MIDNIKVYDSSRLPRDLYDAGPSDVELRVIDLNSNAEITPGSVPLTLMDYLNDFGHDLTRGAT